MGGRIDLDGKMAKQRTGCFKQEEPRWKEKKSGSKRGLGFCQSHERDQFIADISRKYQWLGKIKPTFEMP